jgi:hypothetical protein
MTIRDALQAAGRDLGFAADEIVPVRADTAAPPYNIDALWAKLVELLPEAQTPEAPPTGPPSGRRPSMPAA